MSEDSDDDYDGKAPSHVPEPEPEPAPADDNVMVQEAEPVEARTLGRIACRAYSPNKRAES